MLSFDAACAFLLFLQAPSFRLSQYILNLQHPQPQADPQLPQDMHDAHQALKAAVQAAHKALQQLQQVAEQFTDAALAHNISSGMLSIVT